MPHETVPGPIRKLMDVPALCYDNAVCLDTAKKTFQEILMSAWGADDAWVLGHVTDGVLWGRIVEEKMILANNANPDFGPPLDEARLLDLRVFNPEKELRIWRHQGKLKGCLVREDAAKECCSGYDEYQIFISAERIGQAQTDGVTFSLLRGPSGQTHAVPVEWDGKNQAWRLKVRHYLSPGETGMLTVTESRLLELCLKPKGGY